MTAQWHAAGEPALRHACNYLCTEQEHEWWHATLIYLPEGFEKPDRFWGDELPEDLHTNRSAANRRILYLHRVVRDAIGIWPDLVMMPPATEAPPRPGKRAWIAYWAVPIRR